MRVLRRSDAQVLLLALAAGLPGTAAALALAWTLPAGPVLRWMLTLFIPLVWIGCAEAVRRRFARPLQTLANLIAAVRVGDYSTRARLRFNPASAASICAWLRKSRLGRSAGPTVQISSTQT